MRLPGPLHVVNEGMAFLLEMAAFAVLCWWGFTVGDHVIVHVAAGLGAPALAIALWGTFAAPKAKVKAPLPVVLLVKAVVFAASALAFHGVDRTGLAIAFAVVVFVNTALATADRDARFKQNA